MDFFEKLGKKMTETYKSAEEKTTRMAAEAKVKNKMNDIKNKSKNIYTEMGKKIYEKYVLDGEYDIKEYIQEDLTKLDELSKEMESCELQLLDIAGQKKCESCKVVMAKDAKFCPSCGGEQPVVEEPKVETVVAEVVEESKDEVKAETEEVVAETVEEVVEDNKTEEQPAESAEENNN